MQISIYDFTAKIRDLWHYPMQGDGQYEAYTLFKNNDWTVIEKYSGRVVPWHIFWPLLLKGAHSVAGSQFEQWILSEFQGKSWQVHDGLSNNYASQVSFNQPAPTTTRILTRPPVPAGAPTQALMQTTTTRKSPMVDENGPLLILKRTSGDHGSEEIALHPMHILMVLPYGTKVGRNAAGCRLQVTGGEWYTVQEDYGEVLNAWQAKLGVFF